MKNVKHPLEFPDLIKCAASGKRQGDFDADAVFFLRQAYIDTPSRKKR